MILGGSNFLDTSCLDWRLSYWTNLCNYSNGKWLFVEGFGL